MPDAYSTATDDDRLGDWARVLDTGANDNQQLAQTPNGGATAHVMINNNGLLGHAGMMLEQPGKDSVLFDPGGHYRAGDPVNPRPWGGDAFYGKEVDFNDYLNHQRQDGPDVNVYHFPLGNDEADQIRARINERDAASPGTCASETSNVLQGIGPFKDLDHSWTPSGLGSDMQRLQAPPPSDDPMSTFP